MCLEMPLATSNRVAILVPERGMPSRRPKPTARLHPARLLSKRSAQHLLGQVCPRRTAQDKRSGSLFPAYRLGFGPDVLCFLAGARRRFAQLIPAGGEETAKTLAHTLHQCLGSFHCRIVC